MTITIILNLKEIGKDSHNRTVYEDQNGILYKNTSFDTVPTQNNLCTAYKNYFDSEPDTPLKYRDIIYKINVVKEV